MDPVSPPRSRILHIPRDLVDGNHLYQPLPVDHYAIRDSLDIMSSVADQIERLMGSKEPYEINLLGLRNTMIVMPVLTTIPRSTRLRDTMTAVVQTAVIRPVLTIGTPHSNLLEKILPSLDVSYEIHLSSHSPSSFSHGSYHDPRPENHAVQQQSLPSIGSSCGLLTDGRSVTLGAYFRLGSAPEKTYILTAPLNIGPTRFGSIGNVVTQPSVADRNRLNASEPMDVLKNQDPQQIAVVVARRAELEKTFELARTVRLAFGVQSTSNEELKAKGSKYSNFVRDGSQPKTRSSSRSLACASNSWAILEVTRKTTIKSLSHTKKRRPVGESPHTQSNIHPLIPGLTVSKRGRTTGCTVGTVNGARSLYRLPRDEPGIRRYDYAIVSFPWGGSFGFPGDAGAVVLAHPKDGSKDKKAPCALLVASSTSGHVSFVQDMKSVVAGVERANLGDMEFMELSE